MNQEEIQEKQSDISEVSEDEQDDEFVDSQQNEEADEQEEIQLDSLQGDKEKQKKLLIEEYEKQIEKIEELIKVKFSEQNLSEEDQAKYNFLIKKQKELQQNIKELQTNDSVNKYCILILLLLFGFVFFSKFQEEYYSGINWQEENYYEILGVKNNASKQDIKSIYRDLIKQHHPDKNPNCQNCQETFVKIQKAYEVLTNDEQRQIYDQSNGLINVIDSNSIEITAQNYDDMVLNSQDTWIIQVYENDNYFCQNFAPFWEEIYPQYKFIRFGRINMKLNRHLIKRLPFGIKGFPFVYFQKINKEPQFAEIFLRGNIIKDMKNFIMSQVSTEIQNRDLNEEIENGYVLYLGLPLNKIPQIKMHFYLQRFQELNIKVYFMKNNQRKLFFYSDRSLIYQEEFIFHRNLLEKIQDLIFNKINIQITQENYGHLCKDKMNKCLLVSQNASMVDLKEDQEEKLIQNIKQDTFYSNEDFVQILRVNEDQIKLNRILKEKLGVADLNKFFKGKGLLIHNESQEIKILNNLSDLEFEHKSSDKLKQFFGENLFFILRKNKFVPSIEFLSLYRENFVTFPIIVFSIVFLIVMVKKYGFKFWNLLFFLLTFELAYVIKIYVEKFYQVILYHQ